MLKAMIEWVSGTGPDARPQDLLFVARRRAEQVARFNQRLQESAPARRPIGASPAQLFTPAAALAASRSTTTYADNDLQSVASTADQVPGFPSPTTSR